MGVLNVTPDSFSDGGRFFDTQEAIEGGLRMAADGADIIDIGGESTRPGAGDVSVEEESRRVIPVIEGIRKKSRVLISIDTRKSGVALEAAKRGASIINDVSGLRFDPDLAGVAVRYRTALILMHMKGTPQEMQVDPSYKDLIGEILASLKESIIRAKKSGVGEDKLIIDPGIGFGKTAEHNLAILNRLEEFKSLRRPVCIGVSRKSFIGKVLGIPDPEGRLIGTVASCAIAVMKGANILRVHDVKEAAQAARMAESILKEKIG